MAIINTHYVNLTQLEWNHLGSGLTVDNPLLQQYALEQGTTVTNTVFLEHIAGLLAQQASLLGFINCFGVMATLYIVLIFGLFFFKKN